MTIFKLGEFAAHLAAVQLNMTLAAEGLLSELAVLVRDRAKGMIGVGHESWPALADETITEKERLGYPVPAPLLREGTLKASIQAHVNMHGGGRGAAYIGSNDDVAVYQELGTSRIPPRSFLRSALAETMQRDFARVALKYIAAAWRPGRGSSELVHLLHSIKIALEVAKIISEPIRRRLREENSK